MPVSPQPRAKSAWQGAFLTAFLANVNVATVIALIVLPLGFATTGCSKDSKPASASAQAKPAKSSSDYFEIGLGSERIRIQLAVTPMEQQQGLMHRRDLGANDGMIFIYKAPQPMSFWMRNTPSPLDIGYFSEDGVLQEVHQLIPFDETPVRSAQPAKFALEMPKGWYRGHNVRPGARLDMEALGAALAERGFARADYKLAAPAAAK